MSNNTAVRAAAKSAYDAALDWSARAKAHRSWLRDEIQRSALRGDGAEMARLISQLTVEDNIVRAAQRDVDSAWRVMRAVTPAQPVVRLHTHATRTRPDLEAALRRRFDGRGYVTKIMVANRG